MQKFENMDVIAALESIMHQNTAYYQSDFAYDIKMLREAARSDQPEDKLLLWLSRPSGTFCFRERDVLLKDTQAYNTWKFCGEQTHDRILAYAVELTGAANGTVQEPLPCRRRDHPGGNEQVPLPAPLCAERRGRRGRLTDFRGLRRSGKTKGECKCTEFLAFRKKQRAC